jgi:hypothetical protein
MLVPQTRNHGSILVWTVLTIAILSLLAVEALRIVSAKYQNAIQTAAWQESLLGAESGIDLAIVELRKSLFPAPNHAWEGWSATPGNGVISYGTTTIPNAGLAGTPMTVEVNVDAPSSLKDPSNSWQYYRVRTIGTMPLTGPARVNDNKQDTRLRKFTLGFERFTNGILQSRVLTGGEVPRVSRRAEAIVRPVSAFDQAIISRGPLDLTNQDTVVDSYDSRDAAKSTNGLYDQAKRQQNGDIATNGNLVAAGNAHIYGDVSTNAGTVSGAANITGLQRTDFYQDLMIIKAPSWPSVNASPSTVTGTTTINASAMKDSAASRYVLSQISLSGTQTLTIAGAANGSATYIDIYVPGNISVIDTAKIQINPGVSATIHFGGNVTIAGNGMLNSNNQPADLQLYGIPPTGNPDQTGDWQGDYSQGPAQQVVTLGGNGQISLALYAPSADVTVNGGLTSGHVFGSIVGKSVQLTGVTNFHYDEALTIAGIAANYKIVSWFEDTR